MVIHKELDATCMGPLLATEKPIAIGRLRLSQQSYAFTHCPPLSIDIDIHKTDVKELLVNGLI